MPTLWVGTAVLSGCLLWFSSEARADDVFNQQRGGRMPSSAEQTVSADLLRNPISQKTRRMIQRALESMRSGKHQDAIRELEKIVAKNPSSAAYVHSLLGFEYMQTDQFAAAVNSFEQAISRLPHDPVNRVNLGISLAATGDYTRALEETQRAYELDPDNPQIKRFLDALLVYHRTIAQRQ